MPRQYKTLSLQGTVVLITGASGGIGEAAAWRFAEQGCSLVLAARRKEKLDYLKADLEREHQVPVCAISIDVQNMEQLKALPSQLPDGFREIDILVNNAGLALGKDAVHKNNIEDAQIMINTNVTAIVALTRLFVPGMVERNRGHILNVSSIAAHEAYPGGSIYCGTKHFLDAFTNAARVDLVATQIRVTAISPGAVRTEFSNVRFKGDNAQADAVYQGIIPLNADDCADALIYAATRPAHVQIGEITIYATLQASARDIARVL